MSEPSNASYEAAGVNLEKADTFLGAMLGWVQKTEAIPGPGLRPIVPNGFYASVLDCGLEVGLAMTTDGVGSKILVAERAGDFSSVGIDCIAMNVNDLICVGAKPLAMVDYLAIQDPPTWVGEQIGKSLYEGCLQAGISIPGGELAQLPEMIRGEKENEGVDLAGAAVGIVRKEDVQTGAGLAPGDVLLGIASNGVHSNGFTLVRDVFFRRAGWDIDRHVPEFGQTLGAELLRPTALYVKAIQHLRDSALTPKATLHITGGGFLNLLRADSTGIRYVLDALPAPGPVFDLVQGLGDVSTAEMHRVFNMGVGMVLAVDAGKVDATLAALRSAPEPRFDAQVIGRIEAGEGKSVSLPRQGLVDVDGAAFGPA